MQGSSNNSFIPKRRNSKRQSSRPARKVFLLTIITYSLLFAALLAAAGTAFYKNYTAAQLAREAVLLDAAVNTFSVQDFKRVQEFDDTLTKAKGRVDNTVSMVAVLDELDRITAQPIQINGLELQRQGDEVLLVTLNFSTETLDAALFQRKVLTANSALFADVKISEVDIQNAVEATAAGGADTPPAVTFIAEFSTPLTAALYDPVEARRTDIGTRVGQSINTLNTAGNVELETTIPSEPEIGLDESFDIDADIEFGSETVLPEDVEVNETTI